MGSRAQISIQERGDGPKVYLYTHWGSSSIVEDLIIALEKRWRWDDYEYLARIIFDVMKRGDATSETGFGISCYEHGDNDILIEILPGQKVKIGNKLMTFEEFIK